MYLHIIIVLLMINSTIGHKHKQNDLLISDLSEKIMNLPFLINTLAENNPSLEECVPTFKMVDASAKIPSGILEGNFLDLGNFDECISASDYNNATNTTTLGKYCLVKVALNLKNALPVNMFGVKRQKRSLIQAINGDNSTGLILGWCMPHSCSLEKLSDVMSEILQGVSPDVKVLPVATSTCQTKDNVQLKFSLNDILIIAFLSATLLLIVLSTSYDICIQLKDKKPAHIILIAFSLKTNGKKMFSISRHSDELTCFHGLRCISMICVVRLHNYITTSLGPLSNTMAIQDFNHNPANLHLINSGTYVDTFFIMGGLLVSYCFCLTQDKGVKFNIFLHYIHRYLRLTPVFAVIIWFHATLLPFLGSGPLWPLHSFHQDNCVDYWWSALTYTQNYFNKENMCIVQTWYLNVDMQLFIISPILLIPLWRWPKYTMAACFVLLLGSMPISFYISYIYDLPAFIAQTPSRNVDFMSYYYYQPYTRYSPWLMGFMLGYYLFKLKKEKNKITWHPSQVAIGWIVSLTLLGSVMYSGHDLLIHPYTLGNAFFNGFHHHGWSLGVCWIIYACSQGYGGPINSFLSCNLFQILSRFNYTLYLIHLTAMILIIDTSRTEEYFTGFLTTYRFCSNYLICLIMSICLTLAYESPMVTIEKVIFKKEKTKKETTEDPKQT